MSAVKVQLKLFLNYSFGLDNYTFCVSVKLLYKIIKFQPKNCLIYSSLILTNNIIGV